MTHAKGGTLIGEWPELKPGQRWTVGKKRGHNFNRTYPAQKSPYAAGTQRKLLDRYLKILVFLEKRLAGRLASIMCIELGAYMDLTPAATNITCQHLCDYLTKNHLEARKILQRSTPRGIGVSWEGMDSIDTGIQMLKQHMRQVPK